jgi:hypothetical protein
MVLVNRLIEIRRTRRAELGSFFRGRLARGTGFVFSRPCQSIPVARPPDGLGSFWEVRSTGLRRVRIRLGKSGWIGFAERLASFGKVGGGLLGSSWEVGEGRWVRLGKSERVVGFVLDHRSLMEFAISSLPKQPILSQVRVCPAEKSFSAGQALPYGEIRTPEAGRVGLPWSGIRR